jgi:hypothetical protein
MQTVEFLQTAKWIQSQFSEVIQEALLKRTVVRMLSDSKEPRQGISKILAASHELASLTNRLSEHPLVPEILRAFNLEVLIDSMFPIRIAEAVALGRGEGHDSIHDLVSVLGPLWDNWELFTGSIKPIESLIIPEAVIHEQDFDDILTIELRYEREINPKIETIAAVLTNVRDVYDATARAYGTTDFTSLTVIYADSGSSFRLDFKGLGEPIREIKKLIVELWNRYRHRKAQDFHHNSKAFLDGLSEWPKPFARIVL